MTKPATIQAMPRPRGTLPPEVRWEIDLFREKRDEADAAYREVVVNALASGSFSEVSKATGLSTNTLQRWKREAGK